MYWAASASPVRTTEELSLLTLSPPQPNTFSGFLPTQKTRERREWNEWRK